MFITGALMKNLGKVLTICRLRVKANFVFRLEWSARWSIEFLEPRTTAG